MFYYQAFFFFKYVLYQTVLSKYLGKKLGVTVLVSSETAVKGGHGFEIAVRMDNLPGGDWGEMQNKACFGCFYVFDIANTEIQT